VAFWKFFGARQTSDGRYIKWPRRPFSFFGTTVVDEDSAMQVAAFNRGLIYISTQIAKLPWNVKDAQHNIVTNSPISSLLNLSANPEMNSFRWKLMMCQQAIIHGNAYAEIERDTVGRPIALWPLRSDSMRLVRDSAGNLKYNYTANIYGSPSEPIILDPYDVFHLPNFHTKDGLVGQGIIAFGKEVLGISIATDSMAGGLFRNGGVPSGVLSHPGTLSDEAYDRLKQSWLDQVGGKKMGATAVLEEGVKYEPVNFPPEAIQFLQSRQFGVLEIARFLGLPPTKLFDVVAAKYANVENSNLEVATDTLDSWATNLEMEADVKLLGERYGGRYTDIDLYDIFRGDMTTRATYFKAMMSIGAMTPNQIRAREGLSGYPDGDNYYIATNNFTPVDRMDEIIDADIAQKTKPAPSAQPPNKGQQSEELAAAAVKYLTTAKK
jgi:HK97 family phage portal protein